MQLRYSFVGLGLAALAVLLPGSGLALAQERQADADQSGVVALGRGPIHEAYANPLTAEVKPPPVLSQKPPAAIEELPPDQKPAGNQVIWIPGYWAWDDQGESYIWVSGFWRDIPPGRQWVPGYYVQVEGGHRRVPGYWAVAGQAEVQYLPPPPEPLETAAPGAAPGPNYVYVPGTWVYAQNRYVWRSGYWNPWHAGWFWVPARYCWSPSGYVFVDGFWDYALHLRGLLYAPVRIDAGYWGRPGWYYRPRSVILEAALIASLFIRPDWGWYYYGNYFGDRYYQAGYWPWVDYRIGRNVYDPLFSNYRYQYRNPISWDRSLRAIYAKRRSNESARPLVELDPNVRVNAEAGLQSRVVVAPLTQVENRFKLQKANGQEEAQRAQRIQEIRARRQKVEAEVAAQGNVKSDTPRTGRIDLPAPAGPPTGVQVPPVPKLPRPQDKAQPKDKPQATPPKPLDKAQPKGKPQPTPPKPQDNAQPTPPKPLDKAQPKGKPQPTPPKSVAPPKPEAAPPPKPASPPPKAEPAPRAAPKAPPPPPKDSPKGKGKDKD